nr:signal peptidase [Pirellulaceae bacterium]
MAKYLVRYGVMRHLAVLASRGGAVFTRSTKVIARTNRGLEVGEILCEASPGKLDDSEVSSEGQILREMTAEDANEQAHL